METNTRDKVAKGLIWKLAERFGAQGVQFVVSIVLARLLSPDEFGMISLITVFITISNVFLDSGFGQALVQKKKSDDLDFSSVFYFNVVFSIILYIIMFIVSPFIAKFYNMEELTSVIRVLSIVLIISGVKGIQQAYVQRNMLFKKFFYATLVGTILSAIVSIILAMNGFGVWALVAQQIVNQFFDTLVLWIVVKWRPMLKFSFERLKGLFSYGWKLFCSSLLDTGYNNLYSLIIGKVYSSADLAYYTKGKQFPNLFISNINDSINMVTFPALADKQEDKKRIKSMLKQSMRIGAFLIFPLMMGLAVVAPSLIKIILTDKWIACVPFLRFCCFEYALLPMRTANLQAVKAIGRSDIFLKLEILKKGLGIVILAITVNYGLYALMIGSCILGVFSLIVNAWPNRKLLDYGYKEQLFDLLPTTIITIIMGIIVLCIGMLNLSTIALLLLQVLFGIIVYIILAKIFRIDTLEYSLDIVKNLIKK